MFFNNLKLITKLIILFKVVIFYLIKSITFIFNIIN